MLKAIIFDLDDTLYPERSYVLSGFRAVANWAEENIGIPASQGIKELERLFEQGVRGNTFNKWLEMHGFADSESLVSEILKVYREHKPNIYLYQNALSLIERLKTNFLLGIITDGFAQVQRKKIEALGIIQYFNIMIFTDELGKKFWKPSSKPFKIALEMLKINGPEAVYIADNPIKDFVGARSVNMWTIRVRHFDGIYKHLEAPSPSYEPDFEIRDFEELYVILDNINYKLKNE